MTDCDERGHTPNEHGQCDECRAWLPPHNRPLAAPGLTSYRLKGPYGWIMIGARDADDAMREAARSTAKPDRAALEVWRDGAYRPA